MDRDTPLPCSQPLGRRPARYSQGGNTYLKSHSWDEYSAWHLALTDGPGEQTKARYAFAFVDFSRLHRMGLIACYYRAAEWEHTVI